MPRRLADSDLRDLTDEFVEWFCARNTKPVMKLSEVIEEFKLYKKEKGTLGSITPTENIHHGRNVSPENDFFKKIFQKYGET